MAVAHGRLFVPKIPTDCVAIRQHRGGDEARQVRCAAKKLLFLKCARGVTYGCLGPDGALGIARRETFPSLTTFELRTDHEGNELSR